ncbi:MAG TPA: MBL fold metallo-hydrolase [Bryobacteraceae bacterium]|nr:MBL fold metallo-hydrolase [Bryobacteraceae bacterium]
MSLSIRVLGSGTSAGVPTIGCECATCTSTDPRDTRLRPSILIRHTQAGGEVRYILIDTTPDFRAQMLAARIPRLDAIVYTHDHADHILGLDDVRPFNYRQGVIPLYAAANTLAAIQRVFSYAFDDRKHLQYVPKLDAHAIGDEPFDAMGLRVEPIPVIHGKERIYGFRFENAAYLTDNSEVPEESVAKLGGLDVLFLDALRHKEHPTHSTVAHAIETARRIGARRTFFTHMSHDLKHEETERLLPEGMQLAYDGLEIEVNAGA